MGDLTTRAARAAALDRDPRDFLPLTDLAFNVLVCLTDEDQHGYALIKTLREQPGRQGLRTGTLYAALRRLQDEGLVDEADPPAGDVDERRRYYGVTDLGVAVARAEAERLADVLGLARDKRLLPATDGGVT